MDLLYLLQCLCTGSLLIRPCSPLCRHADGVTSSLSSRVLSYHHDLTCVVSVSWFVSTVDGVSSVHLGCVEPRPMSCYTVLRGWLPPSLPFGCLRTYTPCMHLAIALEPCFTIVAVAISTVDLVAHSLSTQCIHHHSEADHHS